MVKYIIIMQVLPESPVCINNSIASFPVSMGRLILHPPVMNAINEKPHHIGRYHFPALM